MRIMPYPPSYFRRACRLNPHKPFRSFLSYVFETQQDLFHFSDGQTFDNAGLPFGFGIDARNKYASNRDADVVYKTFANWHQPGDVSLFRVTK